MSDVKNLGVTLDRIVEACPKPDRTEIAADLSLLTGSDTFVVSEGAVQLDVPLVVAMAHVPTSGLLAAARVIRAYARVVTRAVATLPAEVFADWADGAGHRLDFPGQRIELLDDGGIAFELPAQGGSVLLDELEKESPGPGIDLADASDEDLHHFHEHVPEHGLFRTAAVSLNHPDPLSDLPRRSTPPP
ncbi:hypothetical protein [Xanthobacter autotrophicus]|uniref:hypothetical protein n=1 Tax=Xanthobacter autotrophicus TaxID=280 RepID=UPI0037264826